LADRAANFFIDDEVLAAEGIQDLAKVHHAAPSQLKPEVQRGPVKAAA
jgi:hypothetical protein